FFSSRRRHTILVSDWSSDVCSSDLSISRSSSLVSVQRESLVYSNSAGSRTLAGGRGMWQDAFSRIEPSFRFKSGMYLLRFKSGMYLLRFKSGMYLLRFKSGMFLFRFKSGMFPRTMSQTRDDE